MSTAAKIPLARQDAESRDARGLGRRRGRPNVGACETLFVCAGSGGARLATVGRCENAAVLAGGGHVNTMLALYRTLVIHTDAPRLRISRFTDVGGPTKKVEQGEANRTTIMVDY